MTQVSQQWTPRGPGDLGIVFQASQCPMAVTSTEGPGNTSAPILLFPAGPEMKAGLL